ncbi:polyketide synthase [Fusarium avenaceum]|nr:polyketide synthase [Fusarium avenaceum]
MISKPEPIAIVGSACRFPGGANSPSSLWNLLKDPHDISVEIGPDRFDAKSFYHPDGSHHGTSNVLRSYLLDEDVRTFDAAFFNLSPNEADSMDPQQRLILETVYESLEAGGHALDTLRGSDTAVYVGTMTGDYNDTLTRDHNAIPNYFATGTSRAIISNRISYFFDWHGPSMTIDTACSSSLIAVHQGVHALRTGESRVALACGTQLLLNPEMYIAESKLKMLSPNGISRMWDEDADGYARGEGMASVVLKKLSDALADGDHIECIIRETGANHDGFSNGLTVPSTGAQANLIRQTYARAGLDPENRSLDRPQFFEAHGTGTQAGDPREAAAIHECFGQYVDVGSGNTPLYVGSVKTVIGHLEGCAGLAGLLKGSLAIQSGIIPPNLHFRRLNSKLESSYQGLHVPTQLTPWPELPAGVPRRVSVNSFGFGGTNAHAILEQYVPEPASDEPNSTSTTSLRPPLTPFVFSAATEASLIAQLKSFSGYLSSQGSGIDPSDLSWTLHARRSRLHTKAPFSALTIPELVSKIDTRLDEATKNPVGLRSVAGADTARLLGIFTGQGAQWPAMGACLIQASEFVQQRIEHLEQSLATLPLEDRPQWSLRREMLAAQDTSRITEAALSQPLCTAVQVVLVDLFRAAGITLAAVVGHSSGEIAAAYAAGFISAHDAIRIAYYRGFTVPTAADNSDGPRGGMLAAGISWAEAQKLVNLDMFKGRLSVAAHNSPASVTLSGDADAIAEAQQLLKESSKFARLLRVDTAYHSHHMLPCGERYIKLLQGCDIQVNRQRDDTCTWFSSVVPSAEGMEPIDALQGDYWRDNMVNPVLFSETIKDAISSTSNLEMAVEIGPHPALQGPVTQNASEVRTTVLPYCSSLVRGMNDVLAFSEALGFLYTRLPQSVDLTSFHKIVAGDDYRRPNLVVDLPQYQWNHTRSYWSESRTSKMLRKRKDAHHEILGVLTPDSNPHDMRWLNVVKPKEIPWLDGHQLQGQIVFPAAGYVAMALEASRRLARNRPALMFELRDLSIPKAITFDEGDNLGVETLVTLTSITQSQDQIVTAAFSCYSVPVVGSGSEREMELTASGTVQIVFGEPNVAVWPLAPFEEYNMSQIDAQLFYDTIAPLGYNYSGPFKGLSCARRRLNQSSALVDSYTYLDTDVSDYLVHPSLLDVSFQAAMLAYSAPGDGRLWSLSVPTAIDIIRVNPEACAMLPRSGSKVPVRATIDSKSDSFLADIDLLDEHGQHGMVQVEGLALKPFAPATSADDRTMFTSVKFETAEPDGVAVTKDSLPSVYEVDLAAACERLAYHYLFTWESELSDMDWGNSQLDWSSFRAWMAETLTTATATTSHGRVSIMSTEDLQALAVQYPSCIDIEVIHAIGQNLPAAVRGEMEANQILPKDLLTKWLSDGLGFGACRVFLGRFMSQITHRYPHARILEIGAGSGEATQAILQAIGDKFSSYTYTDPSQDQLDSAKVRFKAYHGSMHFKCLDMENSPTDQGFKAHSYDIVVVATPLTGSTAALANFRQLLRPGGYVLLAQVTSPSPIRFQSVLAMAPSGWLSPLTAGAWDTALREAGFGGVDAHTPDIDRMAWPVSVMMAQAVDERVEFLRRPLTAPSPSPPVYLESVVILGNASFETARLSSEIAAHLERFCTEVVILNSLPTTDEALNLTPGSTLINLVDLDRPIFKDITDTTMDGLKRMLGTASDIVWVTRGGNVDQPYHTASISFCRTLRQELSHIRFNHMDLSDLGHNPSVAIVQYLLQQSALELWEAPPSTLAGPKHVDFGLLWSREPEVFLDGARTKVPRLTVVDGSNARLNSSRRVITKTVSTTGAIISMVSSSHSSLHLVAEPRGMQRLSANAIRVQASSVRALRMLTGTYLFIGVGTNIHGSLNVFLSETNSSEIDPIAAVPAPMATGIHLESFLVSVKAQFVANSILELSKNDEMLIHCSGKDRFIAAALSKRAARVTFTCDSLVDAKQKDSSWIMLDSHASDGSLRKALCHINPTVFLDLTASKLGQRVSKVLGACCSTLNPWMLFQTEASKLSQPWLGEYLLGKLDEAVSRAETFQTGVEDLYVTQESLDSESLTDATILFQWPRDGYVEAMLRPLQSNHLFSKDKTYLLVGLSGQIGQSLCEWMVSNGAGCVCLTSRHPNVDSKWLDSFRDTGAIIKVMALNVLDMDNIREVIKVIRESCPPIAGVVNGAVVFDDGLFTNMPGSSMRKVLGPKITGSENLDCVFEHDNLDFFILLSSAVCVFGNPGQSNYAAANGYLSGLARRRRRRGLAASAVDLGRVSGIGHVEAAGQVVLEQLVKKLGLPPLSETDLHQVIGEAIMAGLPQADDGQSIPNAVVTTGFRQVGVDEPLRGPWFSNPFFSHIVKRSNNASESDRDSNKTILPISQRLAAASTDEEAFVILQESFSAELTAMLQLSDDPIEPTTPLIELGIDSLVAVEVRLWFLKWLQVDIPVLRIVGGASLAEICRKALEKLLEKDASDQKPRARPESESDSESDSSSKNYPSSSTPETDSTVSTTPAALAPPTKFYKTERISLPQSRFWFLRHMLKDPTTANVAFSLRLAGNLRVGDLERALRLVVNRHEALRTCFVEDEVESGNAFQKTLVRSPIRLERKKVDDISSLEAEYARLRSHVFELETGDVMKLVLVTLSPTLHHLLINYHHIIMDGASFNVFLSDLERAYNGQSLGALPRQYPEFSATQRKSLEQGEMLEELRYWQAVFPTGKPPPVLPLLPMAQTSSRVAMDEFDSHQVMCHLGPDLTARVKAISKEERCTPFHLHLAALKVLLLSLAGDETEELTIGIADASRNDGDMSRSIGFFLNLLALRFRRLPDQTFVDAMVEARNVTYDALEHSRLPFDVLLSEIGVARSSLHSPFFQAFLDYRQGIQERYPWGNCELEFEHVHPGRTAYDVTLDVVEGSIDSLVTFRVQKGLYDLTAANLLLKTYVHLLDTLTRDASLSLDATPLFGANQLDDAVRIGRGEFCPSVSELYNDAYHISSGTKLVSDWPATLPHRIDQVAQNMPERVALLDGIGSILTYSDMSNRIQAISEALLAAGAGSGSRILVYQQPAADWTCSMLAIMRIGAIYVPLDLRNPIPRLASVAKDCSPKVILADTTTLEDAPKLEAGDGCCIINVSGLPLAPNTHIANRADADSPAAILYTSGSTGLPKGITVTHAGLRNEIEGYTKTWGLGDERVLQQSAFTFNHSSDQMYTGLVNGGSVYIVPAEKRGDPVQITNIIQQHAITYTKATPSEYSLWMEFGKEALSQASDWRFAFAGGEPLTRMVIHEFATLDLPGLHFFNSYGPTEISISSHKFEIAYRETSKSDKTGRIPCGYSLPNYYTYIIDEQLQPVPIGMPGEICIGGAGVSLGYLNNNELTNSHFVANPFATSEDIERGWTRMYRTGDEGHLREDGAMIFHNRMAGDSQVKIRGLRIELGDIETNMLSAAQGILREAVVTLREGDPPFLVAHVVFAVNHGIHDQEAFLHSLLSRLPLPQYMVPVAAIPLDELPLTSHSKVDRKAVQRVPLHERISSAKEASELTETMTQLIRVWRRVLGKNLSKLSAELSPSTNFFLVGGNSLLAIRLQARIRQVFHVAIPLFQILGFNTLAKMAQAIEDADIVDPIDWEQETTVPSIPTFVTDVPVKADAAAGKTILITGATGFLGKFLLPQLAAREDVNLVHCIAVRDKPREISPFTSPKVVYHFGDLSVPLLGLPTDEFRSLAGQVDVILHMGAVRSFWDSYHVLQPTNVQPVKELLKLAAPRKVPIHYISTAGVFPSRDALEACSAAPYLPPTDGSSGYVASKWAGERILERSATDLHLSSRIYRLLPASQEDSSQKQLLLDTFSRFIDASNSFPDVSIWKGRIDFIPADQLARALGESITADGDGDAEADTRYIHYESSVTVHTEELIAHIKKHLGEKTGIENIPILEWFGKIKALGFGYLITAQEATVGDEGLVSQR